MLVNINQATMAEDQKFISVKGLISVTTAQETNNPEI